MAKFINLQGSSLNIDAVSRINKGSIRYDQVPEGTRHIQILMNGQSVPTDYFLDEEEIKQLQEAGFLQGL